MIKKFEGFLTMSILYSTAMLIMGIVLVTFPEISNISIAYTIGTMLVINGFFLIMKKEGYIFSDFISLGILCTIIGILFIVYPSTIINSLCVILGIWMVMNSIFKVRLTVILKDVKCSSWIISIIFSTFTIICGILLMLNPTFGATSFAVFLGIILIVYAVSDMVDLIVFKENIDKIAKELGYNKKINKKD